MLFIKRNVYTGKNGGTSSSFRNFLLVGKNGRHFVGRKKMRNPYNYKENLQSVKYILITTLNITYYMK